MDLTLTAAAGTVDLDRREITGLVVPYGPPGRTSAGLVTASRGTIQVPADLTRVKLLGEEHDRRTVVGHATSAEDTDEGLRLTFHVPDLPGGEQALRSAAHHVRDGLSVELSAVELDKDSRLVAARLEAVALVAVPAWDDARVELVAAAPPTDPTDLEATVPDPDIPSVAPLPKTTPARATTTPRSHAHLLAERIAGMKFDGRDAELAAALADITPTGNGAGNDLAGLAVQALGELWDGSEYVPQFVPLIAGGNLTGVSATGWRWKVPPEVADYTGDKAAVPSNAATLEQYTVKASRLAGAHDIDRIYSDLGSPDMMVSYWRLMVESLRMQLDAKAHALIVATAGTAGSATSTTDALVKGTLAVGKVGAPTFALVSEDLVAKALNTASDVAPLGLTAGGLFSVRIPTPTPSSLLPANTVVVGSRNAARLLTTSPPVRVNAVNVPNGGIDAGLFAYYAAVVENAGAAKAYTVSAVAAASTK